MPGNPEITKNFGRLSRTQVAARRRNIKRTGVAPAASEAAPATVEKKVGGAKNNGVRQVAAKKAPKFYGSTPETRSKLARKSNSSAKLRSSITPGTVLILLAGRFRGKRVVFLKQLASGLLLVSGPFKINGVPLRRVNQAYVIATSTKVDISSVSIDEKLNDAYFAKDSKKRSSGKEAEFFKDGEKQQKKAFPSDKSADQKTVDKALIAEINKTENLAKYLGSTFALTKGQLPHLLKF